MKKITLKSHCPRLLIKQINKLISEGYQTESTPRVLFDCKTHKVSYYQVILKK